MWYCYILRCIDENHKNLTYNGSTNNLKRRLADHHSKTKGAKATRSKHWEFYAVVIGCVDHSHNLSLEWRIKHTTNKRKRIPAHCGVAGRIKGLNTVLKLDKWTSKCTIENKDCNFKVYIVEDMLEYLDVDELPDNIEVFTVKKMGDKFLASLEIDDKH